MTCPYSNRSNCAMFDGGKRPSKEWYAEKIRGTLDDDTSAMSPQPQSQSAAVGEAVAWKAVPTEPTTAMIDAGQCGCMDNDVTVAVYHRMLDAAPSQPAKPNHEVNRCVLCGYLQGHAAECPNLK